MPEEIKIEEEIHELFDLTLLLKGIHALMELVGGFVFLFVSKSFLTDFVNFFIKDEVVENPRNFILNYISQSALHFVGSSKTFAAVYLISHGVLNAVIVYCLWKEKLWAYPLSFVVLGFFGLNQLYLFSHSHSLWLLAILILDIITLILVWHEYGVIKNKRLE